MKKLVVLMAMVCAGMLNAQPGRSGSVTVSGSTVINHYFPVAANVQAGTFTVATAFAPTMCPGDLIMIYQAQGAGMNTSNSNSYGNITTYNSAGKYEMKYVASVSGNTITTQTSFTTSFQSAGRVQVVLIPQYTQLSILNTGVIIPRPWKDTLISAVLYRFGGIVAVHAYSITNDGHIHANGAGFRGGAQDTQTAYNTGVVSFVTTNNTLGGEKGESIFGYQPEYDANGGRFCMGAPANGGGGGNAHNAAGGGGANGDNGLTWTGQGVMIANAGNPLQAWSLSQAYQQNGNALTNSSGGGRGGYSWSNTNLNATVDAPNNSSWQGDNRREVGGIGGRPLVMDPDGKMFFGGGGGAAEANNSNTPGGANGGGIVYIVAGDLSGTGTVSANGNTAGNTFASNNDGCSGGGGGGSIILKIGSISGQIVHARGGNGGNQGPVSSPGSPLEADGPGGGGGGGVIASNVALTTANVNGGDNGQTLSPSLTEFPYNGATHGAAGTTVAVTSTIVSFIPFPVTSTSPLCEGSTLTLSFTPGAASYTWTGPSSYTSSLQNPVLSNVQSTASGTWSVAATFSNGCAITGSTSVTITPIPTIAVVPTFTSICIGQSNTLTATGAASYTWQPGGATGSSVAVTPGVGATYTVTGTSAGCVGNATFQPLVETLPVLTVAAGQPSICANGSVVLSVSGAANYTWMPGNLSGSSATVSPPVSTVYSVTGASASGCASQATLGITVSPTPTVFATSSPSVLCAAGGATLNATGATTYSWQPGGLTGSQVVVAPGTTTSYTVTGSSAGCTATAAVTVSRSVDPVITALGQLDCFNSTAQLLVTTTSGGNSIAWSGPSILGPTTGSVITITGGGLYVAALVNTVTGCTGSVSMNVTQNSATFAPVVIPSSTLSCFPGPAVNLLVTSAGNFTWLPPGATTPGTGALVSATPSITTTFTVLGEQGTCTGSAAVTVSVGITPTLALSDTMITVCSGALTRFIASGAEAIVWNPGNVRGDTLLLNPSASAIYTVTGNNAHCFSNTTVSVAVLALPDITIAASSTTSCGETVTLTASGGVTYTWQPGGATGNTLATLPQQPTTYSASGTGTNGCVGSATKYILFHNGTPATVSGPTSTVCQNDPITLVASGAESYTWLPAGSQSPQFSFAPTVATSYTLLSKSGECVSQKVIDLQVTDCSQSQMGVIKRAEVEAADEFYNVRFIITIVNATAFELTDIDLTDDLQAVFPDPVTFTLNAAASLKAGSLLAINQQYDGVNDKRITVSSSSSLAPSSRDSVALDLRVDPHGYSGRVYNTAFAKGLLLTSRTLRDSSNNGTLWDPDGDGNPRNNNVLTFVDLDAGHLFIPNAFSPNGDGLYDRFVIRGLMGRQVRVTVFNRWGNKVYEKAPYDNSWDGSCNIANTMGMGKLPASTYYYVVDFLDGKNPAAKGFVVINY